LSAVVDRLYEGLFLVDSGEAASDWNGINDTIKKTLARGDGQIVSMKKWDERRLAYGIGGKSRGTYILAYFRGDPAKIAAVERAVRLSERIIRALIIRTDKMSAEDMEKDPPVPTAEGSDVKSGGAPEPARAKTRAVKVSAKEAKGDSKAEGSTDAEVKKAEVAGVKAPRDKSAERPKAPQRRRKSTQDSKDSAQPEPEKTEE
jgi:small subunit ribosomal protein S6